MPTTPTKFIPSVSFLSLTKVLYKNANSLPPSSITTSYKEQVVSYSSIAEVCNIDRDIVIQCLKETVHQLISKISSGNTVTLHFKVGDLTVTKG